jgi:hypothetical protein
MKANVDKLDHKSFQVDFFDRAYLFLWVLVFQIGVNGCLFNLNIRSRLIPMVGFSILGQIGIIHGDITPNVTARLA